uniref:Thioredoxin-like protein 1 n=1 Tax=Petromyzon marinus TaxID=7757 RepID=A0AAJ7XHP8_PETMA|nr:thioredoxin-like protein 1 [Petromyzon marinus]
MAAPVRRLRSAAEFEAALRAAEAKIVLVAFTAHWSAPCHAVPSLLSQLSSSFPGVVFLEVDIDQCRTLATTHGVVLPKSSAASSSSSASPGRSEEAAEAAEAVEAVEAVEAAGGSLPAFALFRQRVRLETLGAPPPAALSERIRRLVAPAQEEAEATAAAASTASTAASTASSVVTAAQQEADPTDIPRGYVELNALVNLAGCECLNSSDEHGLENSLARDDSFLESDCDEQLLISMAFNQPVKLYALRIIGPGDGHAPRSLKIFINQTRSMDFDEAERCEATQSLQLSPEELTEDSSVQLRYVKFQHVNNVTVFVKDNQGGEDTTRICYLSFIGTTVQATNMGDFKRIAGKKGESH